MAKIAKGDSVMKRGLKINLLGVCLLCLEVYLKTPITQSGCSRERVCVLMPSYSQLKVCLQVT